MNAESRSWSDLRFDGNIRSVMPGLVPGIHVLKSISEKDVDGRT